MSPPGEGSGVRAADVFVATLEPRPGGRRLRSGRFLVELLRVGAGDPTCPARCWAPCRGTWTPPTRLAFLAEWGATEPDRGRHGEVQLRRRGNARARTDDERTTGV